MTWRCPSCQRRYPDSAIGVPRDNDTNEKEGCMVCYVSPVGTSRFVRPTEEERENDMVHKDQLRELVDQWRVRTDLHHEFAYRDCADDLEELVE